jgi:hypothetical protein
MIHFSPFRTAFGLFGLKKRADFDIRTALRTAFGLPKNPLRTAFGLFGLGVRTLPLIPPRASERPLRVRALGRTDTLAKCRQGCEVVRLASGLAVVSSRGVCFGWGGFLALLLGGSFLEALRCG